MSGAAQIAEAAAITAAWEAIVALRQARKTLAALGHQDTPEWPAYQLVCRVLERAGAAA